MIAVSGANGFLGSHVVCMLLEKGNSVRAFKREHSSLAEFEYIFSIYFPDKNTHQSIKNKLTWFIADVLDVISIETALEGIDEVYHCAAMVSFVQKDRDQMMHINVDGTANMINISLQKNIKKFCHVSSVAAIGRGKSGEHISEKMKWSVSKNNSNYAISKYKAEMEVWRGVEEGLNVVIVNPGIILGTGDWTKGSCRLFNMVWRVMPFYTLGTGGYVDVKDVSNAMIKLMEKNKFSNRFILVGENLKMKDFLDTVATHFNKKKPAIHAGFILSQLAWITDGLKSSFTGKSPSITRETARSARNTFYYSSKKITDTIDFHFTPMSETLKNICNNFLINHQS